MSKSTILHVFNNEIKFSKSFFEFLQSHDFDLSCHTLFQYSKRDDEYEKFGMDLFFCSLFSIWTNLKLLRLLFVSNKLILHNLASPWLLLYLSIFPHLNKKVYWVIWGKDLYFYKMLKKKQIHHRIYEIFRLFVFKKIKHVITHVKGDAQLAQKWYQTEAIWHESFMYPSNLYKDLNIKTTNSKMINIQLGNSADSNNNHLSTLDQLKELRVKDVQIYTPLSYGDNNYAQRVINKGLQLFPHNFIPLTDFLPFNDYMNFLNKIDIAIFAHDRQQAMGNIVTLLGLGKKIYLKNNTTHWEFFNSIGVKVFNLNSLNLKKISTEDKIHNIKSIKKYFSKKNLCEQLKEIFRYE